MEALDEERATDELSDPEKSVESSEDSGSSSFEEEEEEDPQQITDLERNLELMRKRELSQKPSFRYEQDGIVVFDTTVRNLWEDGTEVPDICKPGLSPTTRVLVEELLHDDERVGVKQENSRYTQVPITQQRLLRRNAPTLFFSQSSIPRGPPILVPRCVQGLEFSSAFESGNLQRAIRVSKFEYELWLSEDVNTRGHIHWFYFRTLVRLPAGSIVNFRIVNLIKPASLYSYGLRPFVFSRRLKESTGAQWTNNCSGVSYTQNQIKREGVRSDKKQEFYYTLEWKYMFPFTEDEVYFAQFPPYTYSQMLEHLQELKEEHSKKNILRVNILSKTLIKNICRGDITDNISDYINPAYEKILINKSSNALKLLMKKLERIKQRLALRQAASRLKHPKFRYRAKDELGEDSERVAYTAESSKLLEWAAPQFSKDHELEMALLNHQEINKHKRAVVITARVHPGEVPSSWVMHGLLDFLCSDTPEAKLLRANFIFKLVPMLNPDGVILGNYRCSVLGFDLNRKWKTPSRCLQPTIFGAKNLIRFLREEREVALFVDLHAHSMKKNIFMYGCVHEQNEADVFQKDALIRVIPLLFSQQSKHFSYNSSRFRIERGRESTARVVVFKELNILHSYTCEHSFYGSNYLTPEGIVDTSMNIDDYKAMGEQLAKVCCSLLPMRKYKYDIVVKRISNLLHERYTKSAGYIPISKQRSITEDSLPKKAPEEKKAELSGNTEEVPEEDKAMPQRELDQIDKNIIEEMSEDEGSEEEHSSSDSEQAMQEILQARETLAKKKRRQKKNTVLSRIQEKQAPVVRDNNKTPAKIVKKEDGLVQNRQLENRQKFSGNSKKIIFTLKAEDPSARQGKSPLKIRKIITHACPCKQSSLFATRSKPPNPRTSYEPRPSSRREFRELPVGCVFEEILPTSKTFTQRLPPSQSLPRDSGEKQQKTIDLVQANSINASRESNGALLSKYQTTATYSRQVRKKPVRSHLNPTRRSGDCEIIGESTSRCKYTVETRNNNSSKRFAYNFVDCKQYNRFSKLAILDNSMSFHP